MKKLITLLLALNISLLSLTSCTEDEPYKSPNYQDGTHKPPTVETTVKFPGKPPAEATPADETDKPAETVTEAEEEEPYIPHIYEPEYLEVSKGNQFIDFDYIKGYKGETDRAKVKAIAEAAEKAVASSEKYKKGIDGIKYAYHEAEDYFSGNPTIRPAFLEAYTDDFNGDGRKESFVLVDGIPEFSEILGLLVFVDENNNAEVVQEFYNMGGTDLLDYGSSKQLIVYGHGTMGANSFNTITGVRDGKPVELYALRGDFTKYGCFLEASGWQSSGDFMYFDTVAREYRSIAGVTLDADEVYAMDRTNSLDLDKNEFWDIRLYGGRYYNFSMGGMDAWGETYTYEDGKFTPAKDMGIRHSASDVQMSTVQDVDIDNALASMIKPNDVSRYAKVSAGNEFIDFEFIEDYKGETDTSRAKELAALAEKYLLESDDYKFAMDNIKNYDGYIKDYHREDLIQDGAIKPALNRAIIEDFDGDGKEEAFVIMDMPSRWNGDMPSLRSYLFFVGSDNKLQLLNNYDYPLGDYNGICLLNYGKIKQLIVGSVGFVGVDSRNSLYGVKNGKPVLHYEFRGKYEKYKCFLSGFGWQGGDLMYFDTVAEEYRIIVGRKLDISEVLALDTAGVLDYFKETPMEYSASLIGGKYYCIKYWFMDWGTIFTYENGKFILIENTGVRFSFGYDGMKAVIDIDMGAAEATMKKLK